MSLSTPIAFLIFNRPDLTQMVFEMIAKAKPKMLFVVADGPRFPGEEEKCNASRDIIKKVDWDCEVFTNYSDKNQGCGRRIASGIEGVFSKVDEAISGPWHASLLPKDSTHQSRSTTPLPVSNTHLALSGH